MVEYGKFLIDCVGANIVSSLSALIGNRHVGWEAFRTPTVGSLQGWSFKACKKIP